MLALPEIVRHRPPLIGKVWGEGVPEAISPSDEQIMCIMCATCCKINCLAWDDKLGTGTLSKNKKRKGNI